MINPFGDISIGINTIVVGYDDKQIIWPTISLNYNDDDTSSSTVEKKNNSDTCFDINPPDSYFTYIYIYMYIYILFHED